MNMDLPGFEPGASRIKELFRKRFLAERVSPSGRDTVSPQARLNSKLINYFKTFSLQKIFIP